MATDQFARATDQAHKAVEGASDAADHGQKALNEALAASVKTINAATKAAEELLNDGLKTLREQAKVYSGEARQHLDEGQKFVVDTVKERPIAAALTGLGVGFLLALLFSSRSK
jgi:ElaB/YqjD/DUF883 family membrane-anchored ribosome-binding protein